LQIRILFFYRSRPGAFKTPPEALFNKPIFSNGKDRVDLSMSRAIGTDSVAEN
jgi:hypothetical protein